MNLPMNTTDGLYQIVGQAIRKSQQMEWSLAYLNSLMNVKKTGIWTDANVDTTFNYFLKKTMGPQLNELFKVLDLDKSLQEPLKTSLKERNYVVHNIFNDGQGVFLTRKGRIQLTNRAAKALKHMEYGNQILSQFVQLSAEANNQTSAFNETGEKVKAMYEYDE